MIMSMEKERVNELILKRRETKKYSKQKRKKRGRRSGL